MRLVASSVLALSACLPPPPTTPPPSPRSPPPGKVIVQLTAADAIEARALMLGKELGVIVSWRGKCYESPTIVDEYHDRPGRTECEANPMAFSVRAMQPFEIFDEGAWVQVRPGNSRSFTSKGFALLQVRPLATGTLTLEIRTTLLETSEGQVSNVSIVAVYPDSYLLECISPRTQAFAPCGQDGLSAALPMLRVFPRIGNAIKPTPLLRVNGREAPANTRFTTGVSLVDLVPQARSPTGDGAGPGTYEVAISVGDHTSTATIQVH